MYYVESAVLARFLVYCGEQKVWGGVWFIIIKVIFEKSMNGYNPGYCWEDCLSCKTAF